MEKNVYEWTGKDKWLYLLSMIPFLVVFFGTLYLLSTYSMYLAIVVIVLYVITNIFQAGCCVGCPYRGRYCPALCGVFLGNFLSVILYKNREYDEKFFRINATAGETMLVFTILFPIYWIYLTAWYLVPIYLILIAAHFVMFMPTQCEKCSYNTTCPGGIAWQNYRDRLGLSKKSA